MGSVGYRAAPKVTRARDPQVPKAEKALSSSPKIINETVRNKDFFSSKGWFEKFKKQLHKIKLDGQVALTDFLIAARFPEAGISTR